MGLNISTEKQSKLVGASFEELSHEEMAKSQGSGDNIPLSGPPCFLITAGSALLITFVKCK